jgi:hypothetical protein
MGIALILLSEKGAVLKIDTDGTLIAAVTENKIEVEHNIILDLSSSTDKVIYDNLVFSSYFCTKLNPRQARCSQFKEQHKEIISSLGKTNELYSYTSQDGQAMRVYETLNGAAHFEFKESEQGVLHRYTFTSVEKASVFASQNKDLFKTENYDWDISYLDYIL